ncbi:phosphoglucosamine mutase [Selenomonadales bacterium OttesenSCG-928-I06]|nr:phosphoglucosamine mutase [Selenomonadales bacterium OttesenSCG-928-I06]
MSKYFGTDGVRGEANIELTPELAFAMGRAASFYFNHKHKENKGSPVFFIGRDTRISGQMLESAIAAGICSAGGQAVLLGVAPTPAVAYLTQKHKVRAGIVISASHNPFGDNGIKFFDRTGYKLSDETENELEELIETAKNLPRVTGKKVGTIAEKSNLLDEYIDHIVKLADTDFSGLKIVIDCANGAASNFASRVFSKLKAEIIVINSEPNGININDNCGSTHLDNLKNEVLKNKADLGIAYDGDADRCLAVTEKGEVVDGDQIMMICALELLKENKLAKNKIVATVMSNIGLHQKAKAEGIEIVTTAVGDRYVLEAMLKQGLNLGGEQSGHIIFSDHSATGDGLLTSLKLSLALKKSNKKMSELANIMKIFPQLLVNVKVKTKDGFQDNENIKNIIKEKEEELGENGRILVRPSGTEPVIRVMGEGPCIVELEKIVNSIAEVIYREQS